MMEKTKKNTLFTIAIALIYCGLFLKSNLNSMLIIALFLSLLILNRKNLSFSKSEFKEIVKLALPFLLTLPLFIYSDRDEWVRNVTLLIPFLAFPLIQTYLKKLDYKHNISQLMKILTIPFIGIAVFLIAYALYRQFIMYDLDQINYYFFFYNDFCEVLNVQPTYMALLFSPLALFWWEESLKSKSFILSFGLTLFFNLLLVMIGSRMVLGAAILGQIILFILHFKQTSKQRKWGVIGLVLGFAILVFTALPIARERIITLTLSITTEAQYAKYGNGNAADESFNQGLSPRLLKWNCALDVYKSAPVFGKGVGNTQALLNSCYIAHDKQEYADINYQTHNQYLHWMIEKGLLFLIAMLLYFLYFLRAAFKNKNYLYFAFLISFMFCLLTENAINRHVGVVSFIFLNSYFYFATRTKNN